MGSGTLGICPRRQGWQGRKEVSIFARFFLVSPGPQPALPGAAPLFFSELWDNRAPASVMAGNYPNRETEVGLRSRGGGMVILTPAVLPPRPPPPATHEAYSLGGVSREGADPSNQCPLASAPFQTSVHRSENSGDSLSCLHPSQWVDGGPRNEKTL